MTVGPTDRIATCNTCAERLDPPSSLPPIGKMARRIRAIAGLAPVIVSARVVKDAGPGRDAMASGGARALDRGRPKHELHRGRLASIDGRQTSAWKMPADDLVTHDDRERSHAPMRALAVCRAQKRPILQWLIPRVGHCIRTKNSAKIVTDAKLCALASPSLSGGSEATGRMLDSRTTSRGEELTTTVLALLTGTRTAARSMKCCCTNSFGTGPKARLFRARRTDLVL